ncbi:MAG TPA: 16S rRNA (uracil(1498)-N(3))-methyltransferase [Rariglobus sp.]|nr:16S rRNA (uracil(1498)-N(3))-methyltransferase [Rariglobus sp.]
MNLVLFEPNELNAPLLRTDARGQHILTVLRRREGDTFDVGLVNGPIGKATLAAINPDAIALTFAWNTPLAPLHPITLLIGLPRPQTARDILRDATTLGATSIHFVTTERTDPNYATSSLWTTDEWRRHCLAGAAQAFDTRIPEITWTRTLADSINLLPTDTARLALDNYEATLAIGDVVAASKTAKPTPLVLALGPERGWGDKDRGTLRASRFTLAHLGSRVLRTETAAVASLSIVRSRLGLM